MSVMIREDTHQAMNRTQDSMQRLQVFHFLNLLAIKKRRTLCH